MKLLLIASKTLKTKGIKYEFSAAIWQYSGKGGWHFVSLPDDLSKEIRENLQWQEEGWGRLKAIAKIAGTEWQTAIWFDTKSNRYLLPLKAAVRTKENLSIGMELKVQLWL